MANDSITFHCPTCETKLTVPASLAGVKGPCPKCRAEIQAPGESAAPAPIQPESPDPPQRANLAEPAARPLPPDPGAAPASSRAAPGTTPRAGSWAIRLVLLLIFLLAVAGIVYCVLTYLGNPQPQKLEAISPKKETVEEPAPGGFPSAAAPALPIEIPDRKPAAPATAASRAPALAAMEVVEKFLAARTLAERLPLMETRTPLAELAVSCLSKPLPAVVKLETFAQQSNPVEQVTDIFYNVNFDAGGGHTDPQTLLVRTRGAASPKIVADPFLDTFGGRLAAMAAKKSDKRALFQVIVSPLATCIDESVPNRDKKLTLRLLPQDGAPEIARAVIGQQSKIAGLIQDGSHSLSYGKATPCTVMLQWNTAENPAMPYLEAVEIPRMDWNP